MKSLALACAMLVFSVDASFSQRLADEPILDPGKLDPVQGVAQWTLGCADSNMLLRLKGELDGQPIRVETHARMAALHCSILPHNETLRLLDTYTYVGLSGSMHGPKVARIISGRGLFLYVLLDDLSSTLSAEELLHKRPRR